MRIVSLASEAAPWVKTGGLGDVAGALPAALAGRGHEVHVVVPLYAVVDKHKHGLRPAGFQVEAFVGGRPQRLEVWKAPVSNGVNAWFLAHEVFERDGIYGPRGGDYDDNHERFALWTRGALALSQRVCASPDVLHLHDWQSALAAVDLRATTPRFSGFESTRLVFTIHNLAYMGTCDRAALADIDLPDELFAKNGLEFWGRAALLKGGLVWADAITTVSPRYAQEIRTPAFGAGLDGLLRSRAEDLHGILNGIDVVGWDPRTDEALAARYGVDDFEGKRDCKRALQREFKLDEDAGSPVFGVVSRLAWQKGIDLVVELSDSLVHNGAQLVFLGSGEPGLEARLDEVASRHPKRVARRIGFDDALARRIIAGADAMLMPSRYEPCGLTQMYAMRYGTVPVVRAVGGLDDTVEELDSARDTGTGFKFGAATASAFWAAMQRVLGAWRRPDDWRALARRGMRRDFSWDLSAAAYEDVFSGR